MSVTLTTSAVLLDMDGTLVDSTAVVERIWSDWGRAHGLDVRHVLSVVHGRQGQESMALLLPGRPQEQNIEENRRLLNREITETEGVVAVPGAGTLLAALRAAPHALVTSAPLALARARMAAAELPVPSVAITAENVSVSKPDPEGFLLGARSLGVAAEACVAFEDSPAGVSAAQRAGMRVIGVGSTAAGLGADWVVPDLSTVQVVVNGPRIELTIGDALST